MKIKFKTFLLNIEIKILVKYTQNIKTNNTRLLKYSTQLPPPNIITVIFEVPVPSPLTQLKGNHSAEIYVYHSFSLSLSLFSFPRW